VLENINPSKVPEMVRKGHKVAKPVLYRAVKWLTPEAIEQAKLQYECQQEMKAEANERWLEHEFAMWEGDV
jgi:hypothetical protein